LKGHPGEKQRVKRRGGRRKATKGRKGAKKEKTIYLYYSRGEKPTGPLSLATAGRERSKLNKSG